MAVITDETSTRKEEDRSSENREDTTTQKHKPGSRVGAPAPLKAITLGLAAIAALGGSAAWWMHASSIVDTDDAYVIGHVHQLSSRVSGTVAKVWVNDNQHVKAGQVLLKIDPRDFEISAASAQAALRKAQLQVGEAQSAIVDGEKQATAQNFQADSAVASSRAQVNKAEEALNDAKVGVLMSRAAVKQREAELTRALSDYERYRSLVHDRAVTSQSFDKARQDKEVAEAGLEAARAAYTQAQVKVKEAEHNFADAKTNVTKAMGTIQTALAAEAQTETRKRTATVQEAAVAQARADYENALTQLSYTNVVAPVSGKIGHKTVEVGQQIERGQALMSIVSDEKWVVANFKETQLAKMHVGQAVDIKIDSLPDKVFTGKVESMAPASGAQFSMLPPDNASGNFTKVVQRIPVKIVFDARSISGYEDKLTPGMSVIPEVHVGH